MNIRVGYYADGVYRTLITVSEKGAFEFYGSSRQPTVVEIYDYEYRLLGRVYAANGQTLDVKLARSNPYDLSVDGNETAKALGMTSSAPMPTACAPTTPRQTTS